jgi:hypothetical protein
MPKRKAPGHDNIRNIDLRNLPLHAITHLTKIINVAIRLHYFSKTWTEANVISIPKPNKNPAFPQNRRQISLLDTIVKVMEKAIYKQIYPELSRHIPDEQFAFLPGRDTTLQLLRLTEHVTENFNKRAYTATIFLDVSKAYDTVWKSGLLRKLHTAEMQNSMLCLLKSYLTSQWKATFRNGNRYLQVFPKARLLYNACVSDIARRPGIEISQFADDIAAY